MTLSMIYAWNLSYESSEWKPHGRHAHGIYPVIDNGNRPFLTNPTAKIFRKIVTLVREGSKIFWTSVQKDSLAARNPDKALVTGLARSAHAENEHLSLATMDVQQAVDSYHPSLIKALTTMCSQSLRTSRATSIPEEREYIYRDGQVLIPRLMPDTRLSEWIGRIVSKPEVRPDVYG